MGPSTRQRASRAIVLFPSCISQSICENASSLWVDLAFAGGEVSGLGMRTGAVMASGVGRTNRRFAVGGSAAQGR